MPSPPVILVGSGRLIVPASGQASGSLRICRKNLPRSLPGPLRDQAAHIVYGRRFLDGLRIRRSAEQQIAQPDRNAPPEFFVAIVMQAMHALAATVVLERRAPVGVTDEVAELVMQRLR